jgi:basic amino acid/polyamine antiporter, APA family
MNYSSSMVKIFTFVILIATAAFLVMYLLCSLAALKLAIRGDPGIHGRRLGWLLVVAALAALYSLWTLYGAGAEAFVWNLALFAVGLPVYYGMKWQRRRELQASVAAPSQSTL